LRSSGSTAVAPPEASAVSMRIVVVSWFMTGRPS
jgi:hypothetical protein